MIFWGEISISLWNISLRFSCCSKSILIRVSNICHNWRFRYIKSAHQLYNFLSSFVWNTCREQIIGICEVWILFLIRTHISRPSTLSASSYRILSSSGDLCGNLLPSAPVSNLQNIKLTYQLFHQKRRILHCLPYQIVFLSEYTAALLPHRET